MRKILSKKSKSKNGSSKVELDNLTSSISVAMGLLATLSSRHQSLWIKKYRKTDPEHLRILLQEVMEEIYSADTSLTNLRETLEKSYMGICIF